MNGENKQIARRFVQQLWGEGQLDVADQLYSPDAEFHFDSGTTDFGRGPEAAKQIVSAIREGFPDVKFTVDDLIAEDDKVVVRWTGRGTHSGTLFGIPPSGKSVEFTGIDILQVAHGKITDNWGSWDALGVMRQIGAVK